MSEPNDTRLMNLAWLLIGICMVWRFFYAQTFLLVPDETNYWQWARHLDWGYHDQAPMIAWTIHLATLMFGQTEAAVRLPSILAMTIASAYLVLMAKHWFNARIAFQTALLSQSIFLFNVGALLATSDGLQAAAWAAAGYHTARAFEENRWRHWLQGGIWFGTGMLSKYTMALFLPCVLSYALLSKLHRKTMAGVKPYVACFIGLVMFVPVIWWNAGHHWNSLRHVAYIGGANQSFFAVHLNFLGDYLLSQAALLTPLVFLGVCASWVLVILRRYPRKEWILAYLFFTSFPVILGFAALSLHSRVYGNWPGAGYVPAILLTTAFWAYPRPTKLSMDSTAQAIHTTKIWKWSVGSSYVLTGFILLHVLLCILPIPVRLDRAADETLGWDKLGKHVGQLQARMPDPDSTFLFGLKYQIASELAFYVPGQPDTVSINRWTRPNVYDYWWRDSDLIGRDALGVLFDSQSRQRLLEVFDRVDSPEPFKIFRPTPWGDRSSSKIPLKVLYIYRCYGFKGGLRWIPPNQFDIRAAAQ